MSFPILQSPNSILHTPNKGLFTPALDMLILFLVALSIVLPNNLLIYLFPIYTPLSDLLNLSLVSTERLIPSDEVNLLLF